MQRPPRALMRCASDKALVAAARQSVIIGRHTIARVEQWNIGRQNPKLAREPKR